MKIEKNYAIACKNLKNNGSMISREMDAGKVFIIIIRLLKVEG